MEHRLEPVFTGAQMSSTEHLTVWRRRTIRSSWEPHGTTRWRERPSGWCGFHAPGMERSGVEAWLPPFAVIRVDRVGEVDRAVVCALDGTTLTGMGTCHIRNRVEFVSS